jgi:preprotein translocase subunit Sec63
MYVSNGETMTQLTTEQQFSIHSFAHQVKQMSEAQAKEFLIKLHEQMIVREATYQELLKHPWGISSVEELG